MAYHLGVDLGTTFLAAAVARPSGVGMVPLGDQSLVAPAVVAVTDEGVVLTGRAAQRWAGDRPDRLGRELRRRLDDPAPVSLGGAAHPVTTLLGAQLRDVVSRVSDIEGAPPDAVVLARPLSWSPHRRDRFDEVARAAGLDAHRTVAEAAAATSAALPDRLHDGQIVAVYDLGGGAFEASVVRGRPGGHEVLGAAGLDGLGGVDFDEAILSHVDHTTGGALSDLDADDPEAAAAVARLRQECALAKEALSRDPETVIPVVLPGYRTEVRLTRWSFEQMVRPAVVATMEALSRAVRSAGLISSDLGAVLLMGGSSRIPLVTEVLSQEFGRPTVAGVHPKYPVALGAAAAVDADTGSAVAGTDPAADHPDTAGPGTTHPDTAERVRTAVGAGPATVEVPQAVAGNGAGRFADPHPLDAPTRMLVIPRADPARLLPSAPEPLPRGSRLRLPLTAAAAAAAVAVLVLVLVHLLAPAPAVPVLPAAPSAPAAASTTAPPSTTAAPARTPTATPTRSSTRARSGRTSTRPAARSTTRRAGT